jgi:3-oxoadipate enol-lactonase
MFYTTSDNLNLHYEIHGNPNSKKSLIFLNGLSQSTAAWTFLLPAFAADYKIILCDFIFQGQSDAKGDWRNFDQHAADVAGLINSLNIDKITVVGISYGSLVAQHFALNYPDKVEKLILLSTFAHKTPIFEAIALSWQRALETGGYPLMLDVMLPSVLSESYFERPLIPIDILKAARKNVNTDADALNKLMMATAKRGDYRPQLKAIKTPTLIVHGEHDALLPVHLAKAVHDSIPTSIFEVITGVGHTLNLEAVAQTVQLMIAFLKEY